MNKFVLEDQDHEYLLNLPADLPPPILYKEFSDDTIGSIVERGPNGYLPVLSEVPYLINPFLVKFLGDYKNFDVHSEEDIQEVMNALKKEAKNNSEALEALTFIEKIDN